MNDRWPRYIACQTVYGINAVFECPSATGVPTYYSAQNGIGQVKDGSNFSTLDGYVQYCAFRSKVVDAEYFEISTKRAHELIDRWFTQGRCPEVHGLRECAMEVE